MSTLQEIYQMASDARESVWQQAAEYEREPKVYLHWTAGHWNQTSDHYHICITGDGGVHVMHPLDVATSGTWKRNTGAINIAICGCYGAGSNGLGDEPPTAIQLEALYQTVVAVCEGLWLTIDGVHVMTHGEAANNEDGEHPHLPYAWWNDGYGDGDTRGDLEYLGIPESPRYNPFARDGSRGGDVIRSKSAWYLKQWKNTAFPW